MYPKNHYTLRPPGLDSVEISDGDDNSVSSYNSYFDNENGYEDCLDMDAVDSHNLPDYDLMLYK